MLRAALALAVLAASCREPPKPKERMMNVADWQTVHWTKDVVHDCDGAAMTCDEDALVLCGCLRFKNGATLPDCTARYGNDEVFGRAACPNAR